MDTQSLKAEKRKIIGRKVNSLRKMGMLPANIYGSKVKSEAIKVDAKDFVEIFAKTGETGLVELNIGGKKRSVLIHNVQTHPVTDLPIHADFLQVDLKAKVRAQVPLELIGESPAEKEGKGTSVQYVGEVEVEALPADLPGKFEIDLGRLAEVGDSVKVADLKVDKSKVEIKNEAVQVIVKVEPPSKEEEEPQPVIEEQAEEGEEPSDEGRGGAEGEKVSAETSDKDKGTEKKDENKDKGDQGKGN